MNRNIKDVVKKVVLLILCLCMVISTVGCEKKDKNTEKKNNYIYYIDKKTTKLVPKEYTFRSKNNLERIGAFLEELKRNTDDVEIVKAIPDKVDIIDYSVTDGVLSISFNSEYYSMKKAQEVLTRAAVVLTMTQLDNVEEVSFLIEGQPLKKTNGEEVGKMKATDFADNLNSDKKVYNTDNFTIYFANPKGTQLVKYDFEAKYGSDISKEQLIINKLLEGPAEEEGYCRTVSANVEVVSVVTMDNICYVTFGENFLTEQTRVSDNLVIYSIVNSLSEIPYIHKVQISINGKTDAVYHGTIALSEPFTRNLDFVEQSETTGSKEN